MSVYVDHARIRYRGMLMNHMIADTLDELHEAAARVGLRRSWFQGNASFPHYDLCLKKREIAVRNGVIPLDRRDFGLKMREIRANWGLGNTARAPD